MTEDLERRLRDVAATAPRPATDADRVASILIRAQHRRRRRLAGGFAATVALVALGFGIRNVDTPVTRVATDPAGEPTATSEPVPAQPTTTSTVESSTTTLSLAGSTPASPTSAAPQSTVVETVNLVPGTDKAACVRADVTGAVIAQSPGGRLWAVMDQSIGVSDDGGGTWRWGCGRAPYNASRLIPTTTNEAWAISAGLPATEPTRTPVIELVHTADAGRTWRSAEIPFQSVTDVEFVDPRHGWAVGHDAAGLRLARTVDGRTWSKLEPPDPRGGFGTSISFTDAENGWMSTGNPSMLYVTSDGGDSWRSVAFAEKVSVYDLVSSAPGRVAVGAGHYYFAGETPEPHDTTGLVYSTEDFGATWSVAEFPEGTVPCCNTSMASAGPDDLGFVLGTHVVLSHDRGRTWARGASFSDDWTATSIAATSPGRYVVALAADGNARISKDAGRSWSQLRIPYRESEPG